MRRPRRVYDVGDDPDARFTLANERTLLAWLRTALGLVVAGVAIVALTDLLTPRWLADALAGVAFAGGGITAVLAYLRWQRVERALRTGEPLPSGVGAVVVLATILVIGLLGSLAVTGPGS